MTQNLKITCFAVSAVVFCAVGLFLWKRKKSFVKVGTVSKLLFFPVRSMKGNEVKKGYCSRLGLEVDGLLDRSFMIIDSTTKSMINQKQCPILVLFTCRIEAKTLIVTAPGGEELTVEIKDSLAPDDVIVEYKIFSKWAQGVYCGDEAASFFRTHLKVPGVQLVRQFPSLKELLRKSKDKPIKALHILSQASINDLNAKLVDKQVSHINFRPNILVEGCKPFKEDSWQYVKFKSEALLKSVILTDRCLITTNDPSKGVLSNKEPLVTLRKYRIPEDKDILKKIGPIPCFGLTFAVLNVGEVSVGDDVFAVIGKQPAMQVK